MQLIASESPREPVRVRSVFGHWFAAFAAGITAHLRRQAGPWMACILGLLWFIAVAGPNVLDPRRIDMFSHGDLSQHLAGWLFYRRDPWQFPLGKVDGYLHPIGTNVAFTDSNPWLSLFGKIILGRTGPSVQLIGPWLALCCALQGIFGARLIRLANSNPFIQAIGGLFFSLSTVLITRFGHDTLCAQWLILGALENGLAPRAPLREIRLRAWRGVVFNAIAGGLHPYLVAMVLPLTLAALIRWATWREESALRQVRQWVITVVAALVPLFAFGYLPLTVPAGAGGFGEYSSDILTFFDSLEERRSAFFPPLPHGNGQYEGSGYLGLGGFFILGMGTFAFVRRKWWQPDAPLPRLSDIAPIVIVTLLFAIFALSSRITLAGHLILDLQTLYHPFASVTNALRSSGRFIWPLHYLVLVGGVIAILRCLSARIGEGIIVLAVILQLFDGRHIDARQTFPADENPEPQSPIWSSARGDYHHLVMYPPQMGAGGFRCPGDTYSDNFFIPLALRAERLGLTINSGFVPRVDDSKLSAYCDALRDDIAQEKFQEDAIYVVSPPFLDAFKKSTHVRCSHLDGFDVCASTARPTSFLDLLADPAPKLTPIEGDDTVSYPSGWYEPEHASDVWRWAPRHAVIRLRRPNQRHATLILRGFCPPELHPSPTLTFAIRGKIVDQFVAPNGRFTRVITIDLESLPPSPFIEITFDASDALHVPTDTREFSFGILSLQWPGTKASAEEHK